MSRDYSDEAPMLTAPIGSPAEAPVEIEAEFGRRAAALAAEYLSPDDHVCPSKDAAVAEVWSIASERLWSIDPADLIERVAERLGTDFMEFVSAEEAGSTILAVIGEDVLP